jgi:ATP-binding cassette subfamily B multidrug efflux pump
MNDVFKLLKYIKPYWRRAVVALLLLTTLVIFDLSIPLLIQHLINSGIVAQNKTVVIQTSLLMLGLSLLSFLIAIGNNITSIQVSENFGRDLRDAIFNRINLSPMGI